jgi:hypothetical protein
MLLLIHPCIDVHKMYEVHYSTCLQPYSNCALNVLNWLYVK